MPPVNYSEIPNGWIQGAIVAGGGGQLPGQSRSRTIVGMSRKLHAFLISELDLIRVRCQACKKVIELGAEDLANVFQAGACPLCAQPLTPLSGFHSPFVKLAQAIKEFKGQKGVEIEFILEDKS